MSERGWSVSNPVTAIRRMGNRRKITSRRKEMARYIFLQYVDESKAPKYGSPELNAQIDAFAKYLDEVKAPGAFKGGDPCQPSAAGFSVRVRDGRTKTSDGPMAAQPPGLNRSLVLDCQERCEVQRW